MNLQSNDPHLDQGEQPPVDEKEAQYLRTLQEASDYLKKGTPLYQREKTATKGNGKNKFLKTKDPKVVRKKILKILLILLAVVLAMVMIASSTFYILYRIGRNKMLSYEEFQPQFPQPGDIVETLPTEPVAGEQESETTEPDRILTYDDGKTVSYKGETYVLNENITTVLLIGVDRKELEAGTDRGAAGEADCIMLLSMDAKTGETKIVNISRESYAQVDIYSVSDAYIESKNTQICRAYAYGDGAELSCENTVKSVRRILYGMPIHTYVALDMRFIGAATDAVGGITVTALSDVKMPDDRIVEKGTVIELRGAEAERYVRYRDRTLLNSNLLRMERQKQYVALFVKKALSETKRDLTTVMDLYKALSQYMTTDLSVADVTFLFSTFLNQGATYEFSAIQGRLDRLDENAIYYLDETDIYETVLDLYYTKVE